VLSKTGYCNTTCTSLWLAQYPIFGVADGTFDDLIALQQLYIGSNLGCVPGVHAEVEVDRYSTRPTPRCPANCSMGTYYQPDDHMCVHCPDGLSTHGIGGWGLANCTGDLTTTSSTRLPTTTPPPPAARSISAIMNANLRDCAVKQGWREIAAWPDFKGRFAAGGLGKMKTHECHVWLCDRQDPCVPGGVRDMMCYAYNDSSHVFVPLDFNSNLLFVRGGRVPA